MRTTASFLVASALALCCAAPAAAQDVSIKPVCNMQVNGCDGWFRVPVTLEWVVDNENWTSVGCITVPLTNDTKGSAHTCEAGFVEGGVELGYARRTAVIRVDRTAPIVEATPARPPDYGGWYSAPVAVAFTGTDATSGLGTCTSANYAGEDSATASVAGTCADIAGNVSAPFSFRLRYDATQPAITSIDADRPPDHDGWYRAPVTVSAQGEDAVSGLAGCDPVTYAGPDTAAAAVTAGCRDRAGNAATRTLPLRYDATAPSTAGVRARPGDRVVRLELPADATAAVVRTPGVGGADESRLAAAATGTLADRRVRNGRAYRYRVTLTDQAGNAASRTLRAVPGPRLRAPAPGAQLAAPPELRWTPVRGARYYNVQLKRDGKKVLSRWPGAAHIKLPASWRFKGRRYHLEPGRYRWQVWPGKGSRAKGRYGPKIGARSFEVVAPAQ